jgi:hypothetical protein
MTITGNVTNAAGCVVVRCSERSPMTASATSDTPYTTPK